MKKILFISALLPCFAFSQKIDINKYSKFDSAFLVTSTMEPICGTDLSRYASLQCVASKVKVIKQNYDTTDKISFTLIFLSDRATSIDKNSKVKFEFVSGKIGEYENTNQSKIYNKNDFGFVLISLSSNDQLLKENIKAVRIDASAGNMEYEIDANKQEMLLNTLKLVMSEPYKE